MLHAQMSRRLKLGADREHVAGAGHNVAIETNAGAVLGGTDDNCRTALRTTVDFAGEVRSICIARDDRKASRSRIFRMASLQENRTVLTYLHPVFFQRDLHCRPNDQKKHLQWRASTPCAVSALTVKSWRPISIVRTRGRTSPAGCLSRSWKVSTLALASKM